jgi:hypothetical protein
MKKRLDEQKMETLTELIRQVSKTIYPQGSDYHYLYHKDIRDRLYGEKPSCFICLKRKGGGDMGRDVTPYMLPICNRAGHEDAKVIGISLKIVQKMMDDDKGMYDVNDLNKALGQLQHRYNIFSKDVPKPPVTAAKKAMATRMMKKIKGYLDNR